MAKIILKKSREDSLKRFHPWVFSGAIAQIVGNPAEGDVVSVYSSEGEFLAAGHYQIGSIAVRVLSFETDVINDAYWEAMLSKALEVRIATGLAQDGGNTNCYRLVHGEGDNLPGLIIDWYDGVCVMQAHSAGMFRAKKQITDALVKIYGDKLKAVYDKSSGTAPFKAGLDLIDGYVHNHQIILACRDIFQIVNGIQTKTRVSGFVKSSDFHVFVHEGHCLGRAVNRIHMNGSRSESIDGKSACIAEQVQHIAVFCIALHKFPVLSLVKKESGFLSLCPVDEEFVPVLQYNLFVVIEALFFVEVSVDKVQSGKWNS